jgi:hypothetical protein
MSVLVFYPDGTAWLGWTGAGGAPARDPVIGHPHFTGTGTRFLRDNGRAAVEALFRRTFG